MRKICVLKDGYDVGLQWSDMVLGHHEKWEGHDDHADFSSDKLDNGKNIFVKSNISRSKEFLVSKIKNMTTFLAKRI